MQDRDFLLSSGNLERAFFSDLRSSGNNDLYKEKGIFNNFLTLLDYELAECIFQEALKTSLSGLKRSNSGADI